jgi:hypothetical protein
MYIHMYVCVNENARSINYIYIIYECCTMCDRSNERLTRALKARVWSSLITASTSCSMSLSQIVQRTRRVDCAVTAAFTQRTHIERRCLCRQHTRKQSENTTNEAVRMSQFYINAQHRSVRKRHGACENGENRIHSNFGGPE